MINDLSVHAAPSNKKASYVCYASLLSSALCVGVCFFIDKYQAIFSALAVVFITVAIVMYTRYMAASYIYDLTSDADGKPIFVVRSRTGKRDTTLLRIDIYAIESLKRLSAKEIKTHKCDTGVLKYNYCPTLSPDSAVLMTVRSHYENADVFIEVSDEFTEYLANVAKYARDTYTSEE